MLHWPSSACLCQTVLLHPSFTTVRVQCSHLMHQGPKTRYVWLWQLPQPLLLLCVITAPSIPKCYWHVNDHTHIHHKQIEKMLMLQKKIKKKHLHPLIHTYSLQSTHTCTGTLKLLFFYPSFIPLHTSDAHRPSWERQIRLVLDTEG